MRALRSLALISCLAVSVVAETPAQDWRFAHPGATLVGSFRVKAMLDSPLLNSLITQATAKNPSSSAIVGLIRGVLGGVSEVRFSVLDKGKGQDPDVLALVTGQLDEAMVTAMAKGKASVHRLDANTLLLGEGQSLDEAVNRLTKPATGLQARALDRSKTLVNYDLWLAGTVPDMAMNTPILDSLRGLALGLSAQEDLRFELALETASAKAAEDLVTSIRKAQVEQPAVFAVVQSEVEGSTARFRFVMEGKLVMDAMMQAEPMFRETVPATQAKRDTIRIIGLDDGPREIKTKP